MISQNRLTRFSLNLLISTGLVVLLAVAFALYILSEQQVKRANELRYRSYLLADELRQSGDDLTRMVRTYVATGDPSYKQHFQDILDIRDGKKPRPDNYSRPYWDLVLSGGPVPRPESQKAIPLLELMRQAGFTEEEFRKLKEAKANSDALTAPEFEAMKLVESAGPEAEANRARAQKMLYDDKFHQAKVSVMKPIHDFFVLVDQRTLAAVGNAENHATALRYVFVLLGLGLMFMLRRTYAALRDTLGGSLAEVNAQIARIGSGDFTATIRVKAGLDNSVLGWLSATQARLNESARERKQAAEVSRQSEQRFRATFEQAAVGVAHVDLDGRFLLVNQRYADIVGRAREELLTCTFQEITHPEDLSTDLGHLQRLLAGRIANYSMEKRCVRKDSALVWVNLTVSLLRDDSGAPKYFIAVVEDITPRKQSEAVLKSIEWMLTKRPAVATSGVTEIVGQPYGDLTALNTERTILDAVGKDLLHDIVSDYMNLLETSSAVYEKNGDYAYGIFTSGWCQTMDLASFRGCGTSDNREALSCGKWHCHESCWNEASRKSMETSGPTDIACRGGIRLYAVPIQAGDEIVGSINFGYGEPARDLARLQELAVKYGLTVEELQRNGAAYETRPPFIIELAKERLLGSARLIGEIVQRHRAEKQIHKLNAELEQRVRQRTAQLEAANKELEAFSYSVSHDLRAPLRHINGFSQALLEDYQNKLDEPGKNYLREVRGASQQMAQLIDDVLQLARVTRSEMRSEVVNLSEVARTIVADLQKTDRGRSVTVKIDDGLVAQGDQRLLRVMLTNLLENAWKFTSKRAQAEITVGQERNNGESSYFVRDNGAGFDMTYVDKLFGAFQRLHTATEFEGTGIGLATVQRIINRHGGRVWAEGAVNVGATLNFTLPNFKETG